MKTLLRNIPNGLYFRGPDQWTSNPAEALNFKSIDRAVEFVQKWGLKEVELAFAFEEADEVKHVPLEKTVVGYDAKD